MGQDFSKRVTRVTLELSNGETESYAIHDNDGVLCLMVSKEQDFAIVKGYCGTPQETGIVLLDELVQNAKVLEETIRMDKWWEIHRN